MDDEFYAEDFEHLARILRTASADETSQRFRAYCSNNLNIILAALDLAAKTTKRGPAW